MSNSRSFRLDKRYSNSGKSRDKIKSKDKIKETFLFFKQAS